MKFYRSAFVAVLSVFAVTANAASVTLYGTDVSFTFDDSTLFGGGVGTEAIVVGNSIFFQPTDFRAESTNGSPAAVSVSDTLNITVAVTSTGYVMNEFTLVEFGDYQLSAGDTSVTASGRLQVTSQTTTSCPSGFNIICKDTDIFNATGLDTVGSTTDWSGSAGVNLSDVSGWGSDTLVTAQIQNNLGATTLNDGETAWIQKKLGGVGLEVSVVPVPAAVWLFGSALGMLGWMRRRSVLK